MNKRYCPQCGKENLNNSNFCSVCGADLREETTGNAYNQPSQQPTYPEQNNQYNQSQDYYEELVYLRRKSPALQIVSIALSVGLVLPMAIYLAIYGYWVGTVHGIWQPFVLGMILISFELIVEPISIIFGFMRLTRLNNCANKPILYCPTKNTFYFPRGNNPLEIYGKNIVCFSTWGYLRVIYYDYDGQKTTYIGWPSVDVMPILNQKLEESKASII